jgi:hypothetical protein
MQSFLPSTAVGAIPELMADAPWDIHMRTGAPHGAASSAGAAFATKFERRVVEHTARPSWTNLRAEERASLVEQRTFMVRRGPRQRVLRRCLCVTFPPIQIDIEPGSSSPS